jgi:RNA polymerase primary sigma factor
MLGTLPPRYEKVVRMINGLGGQPTHPFWKVGLELKVTVERARQIYLKALKKLSTTNNLEKLKNAGIKDVYGIFKNKGIIRHQKERNLL